MDVFSERRGMFLRQYWLPIIICLLGLMFLVYGLMSFSEKKEVNNDMVFEPAKNGGLPQSQTASKSAKSRQIVIDVEGAVQNPGVYQLEADARVEDALVAAGGMDDQADRAKVSQGLNLAAKLTDGGKIYIPFQGEAVLAQSSTGSNTTILGASSTLININSASSSELEKLKGIGPVTAGKIIENRPYGSVDELASKKIVGQKVFEGIKDQVRVY